MLPLPVPARVPMTMGLVKLPLASLSWAVKMLPALKGPVVVKGTLKLEPEHQVTSAIASVCRDPPSKRAMRLRPVPL